jgi:hypothetical protein
MARTHCAKCGKECAGSITSVNFRIVHKTNRGQFVGEDEFASLDGAGRHLVP